MFTIKSEIEMDVSHYLSGYDGKCKNIHGHRYRLVAKVSSEKLHQEGQLRGMVDDFGNLKKALKRIHDYFDHKLLLEDNEDGRKLARFFAENEMGFDILLMPYRTTAEEMSRDIFRRLRADGLAVTEVELFETPTNSCIYSE